VRPGLDLPHTTVVLDFDGAVVMHSPFGGVAGREAASALWDRLPRDEGTVASAVRQVVVDPAFARLVDDLRDEGAEILVIADGLGADAREVLAPFGVPLLANDVDWASGELRFPHADRCCSCATCGTCKQAPIQDIRDAGRTAVLVGANTTDAKAALLASLVFARDALARWCEEYGVPHTRFAGLADVHRSLVGEARR
jgi:2-hydroxy-3-keto-5-methylthiopentenyl-1-phosphate phosphatase